jgi:PAS domain S-box-containing protein
MHSLAPRALPAMPVDGIFQALPDTAFRLDSNGLILEFNAAAMVEVGVGAGAGRPIQTAFNCDGAEPFTAALRQLADSGATVTLEYACSGCGGGIHHEARLTPLPDGKVLLLIRDITSRRLIEQALRDSDAKFRDLADNVSDVLWIRSPDMQEVHYVSPGFERIWGRPMPLLYGNPQQWVDFIVPEDRERVTATFAGLTRDVRSLDIEYRILRPHGEVRWIRARGYQVRDAQDRLIRNTGIVTDITDQRRAQAALDLAQRQLRDASRRAGMAEIATNVLHDVGNILNSVTVSAGLLRHTLQQSRSQGLRRAVDLMREHEADLGAFLLDDEKGRLLPRYLRALDTRLQQEQQDMVRELENLTRSIDHIRDVITTQQSLAGRPVLLETGSVRELVEDALRINDEALTRDQVTVLREFAPVPLLRLDRGRVLQILVNLVGNARDAVAAMPVAARRLRVQVQASGEGRLRLSIVDDGEGIPKENLPQLFVHGFTTRSQGHGFGLHSCALAAAQMGGTLTAHSDGPGRGATFTLELPLLPAAQVP